MEIFDPLHDYISFREDDDLFKNLVDTSEFQRLRGILQLGMAYISFPGAVHHRFIHSIGVYKIAQEFAHALDFSSDKRRLLQSAALLHDIGHGPFSHTSEVIYEKNGHSHEDFSIRKIQSEPIKSILENGGVDPDKVTELVKGKGELGSLMAGDIDVDRLDYLMRDSHFSGVRYGGGIEKDTVIRSINMKNGELVFNSQYVTAITGVLFARQQMHQTLYYHQTALKAERMMEKAMENLVEHEDISSTELSKMDDSEMLIRLRNTSCKSSSYLMERLDERNLFSKTYKKDLDEEQKVGYDEGKLEQEIAREADIKPRDVAVCVINISPKSLSIKLVNEKNEIKKIAEESDMAQQISQSTAIPNEISVFCGVQKDKVKKAAEKIL